eukprot:CAMPEP_0118920928 /NCGR_PEP_ID=MMETSP1169-20130426/348_1 /TAXON_ID=36882 /ORGANISM="Pyramimonas obovata, Strain CCMP722" /LENGTH=243 /DNA_ID=CAMNT_0006861549 /DNA_START=183 /DNA_END=914 /DNA_ORIENTATION=-
MDDFEPYTRFSAEKYDMSEEPICSPLDLCEVNLQIREAEEHPSPAESAPKFLPVPSTNGCISLYHFPSGNQMKQAKQAGCTDIVTLQNPSERIDCINRWCEKLDMGWIQFDFWTEFAEAGQHMKILQLVDEIIAMLKRGAFVMIHCAAGIHRTGLLAYIVLRRLGMPYREAREYLRVLRPATRECVGDDRIKLAEVKFMKLFQHPEIVPRPRIDETDTWKKVPSNRVSEILNGEALLSRVSLS